MTTVLADCSVYCFSIPTIYSAEHSMEASLEGMSLVLVKVASVRCRKRTVAALAVSEHLKVAIASTVKLPVHVHNLF